MQKYKYQHVPVTPVKDLRNIHAFTSFCVTFFSNLNTQTNYSPKTYTINVCKYKFKFNICAYHCVLWRIKGNNYLRVSVNKAVFALTGFKYSSYNHFFFRNISENLSRWCLMIHIYKHPKCKTYRQRFVVITSSLMDLLFQFPPKT